MLSLIVAGAAAAQRTPAALKAAARDIIHAARYAALITVDADGRPQARTVEPFEPDAQMVVWFATNPRTGAMEWVFRRCNDGELRRWFDHRAPRESHDLPSARLSRILLLSRRLSPARPGAPG